MNPFLESIKKNTRALILLTLVAFLTFLPSVKNMFLTWDDPMSLDYSLIHSLGWEGLHKIFTTVLNTTYTPLTILSFAVEHHFFQYNFIVFHLNNVLLHVGVVLLAYLFLLRLDVKQSIAFFSILMFAVHPMKVESVAWITERKDVLYAVLYLSALHTYLSYLHTRKRRFYGLTFILGIFSMLSKPMALSLPLILLLCDWYVDRKDIWRCLWEKVPFFLYILPLAYVTHSHNHNAVTINENIFHAVLIFIWTYSFYLYKFVLPIILVPLYAVPQPISLANPIYPLSIMICAGSLFLIYRWRHNRLVTFSFMFYIASIFFLLRFNTMPNLHVVADRFIYLPSLGLCLIIVTKGEELLRKKSSRVKKCSYVVFGLILIVLTVKCVFQQRVWQNTINLWTQVITHEPTVAISYNNRGFSYLGEKQLELAEKDFQKAIEIIPDYAYAYSNLGSIYYLKKDYPQAIRYLQIALSIDPAHGQSYNLLGKIYEDQNNWPLAYLKYTEAIQHNPDVEEFYFNRARISEKQGNIPQMVTDLKNVIQLSPRNAIPFIKLGDIYSNLNDWPSAMSYYQAALAINPKSSSAHHNLGIVLAAQGNYPQAVTEISRAIDLEPNAGLYVMNRSKIYNKMNMTSQAREDALKAQSLGISEADQILLELNQNEP